jgi:hypothetical protein
VAPASVETNRALLSVCRALLSVCRALLSAYRALLSVQIDLDKPFAVTYGSGVSAGGKWGSFQCE